MHRVLLFVEPYAVRSGPGDFATPARIFGQIAAELELLGISAGVICNSTAAAGGIGGVRYLTPAAFGLDEAMSPQWQRNWVAMLNGDEVEGWGDYYRRALDEFNPTLVYLWNTNSLFQKIAQARGVACVHWEYGGVRAPGGFRIAVDPAGFGPHSALATTPFTATDEDAAAGWTWAANHILRDCIEMHAPGTCPTAEDAAGRRGPQGDLESGILNLKSSALRPSASSAVSPLHVALLLQKEDDVNFLLWPSFPSMWDFVQQCLRELSARPDIVVTVRPHPAGLEDYRARIAAAFPAMVIDNGRRNFYQAMLDYDAVITLNSAGGFEALMCGKPVLSMSDGFYDCSIEDGGADGDTDGDTDGNTDGNAGQKVRAFVDSVRTRTYWTPDRRRRAGAFLHRLVSRYSVPQEMLLLPSLHRGIVEALAGKSPTAVAEWFESNNLARLVSQAGPAAIQHELGALRAQNHQRSAAIATLSRRRDELEREVSELKQEITRHREGLDHMTRDNLRRDADIAELSKPILQRVREKLSGRRRPDRDAT